MVGVKFGSGKPWLPDKKNPKNLLTILSGFGIMDAVKFEYHLGCDEVFVH